ncbi:hypothetical protein M3P21_08775 [Ruegeria sp. 2012CJ41-6]|uniref:Uncharacterized protein n=1 Tax=Ruegeria spongiae TaxID=2942209 RepID=A0ABT0Q1F9_9RHOB|nr:hypothetical protein [Ruegeria spongiae]MCL6283623.1 hypothetical protein [Ruegeria spongiae]
MTANEDYSNFLNILSGSEAVAERWANIAQQVAADAKNIHGVDLDETDVLSVRAARCAALGDGKLGDYHDELSELVPVAKQKEEVAHFEALQAGDEQTLADTTPTERMNAVRAAQTRGQLSAVDELSESQALAVVLQIENPVERLRIANAFGIGRAPVSDRRERRMRGR